MVAADLPIGQRIRHYRKRAGREQAVVAGLCGLSTDYLSQIERGIKTPSLQVLQAIARELGVPVSALLDDTPAPAPAAVDATPAPIVEALLGYGPARSAAPAEPAALRERVEGAWRIWQSSPSRFSDTAELLPVLVADVEHAVRALRSDQAPRREALRASADLYFLLRSYLRRTGRPDLAMMAADRAVRAAEDADDPLRIAAAQWNLGHALLGADEPEGAEQVALRAAERVRADAPANAEAKALDGALQLVAVIAAARRRDWWGARDRLEEKATPTARVAGEGNVFWTVFGPTNVELHNVSIEMEAGQATEALHMADAVDTSHLPSMERAFTFTLDVARCYDLRREDASALLRLLDLERIAPEDLARTPVARQIILTLLGRARGMHARQVEGLATRLGIV
ncbi:helix-turn-helix domain-containing protein [Phaeacidiphilus oryzae]|uniref:helix-turn-helix domain-containing protein n=1 Tax=Phaeacidiphilus oryzae TaxID=348818 RepID=UPI000565D403|nr:helix-turn-helix transcriptional regulator [Phaeacidiphilus oryzae]